MSKIKQLSCDIETFNSVDLKKSGVYKYAESPDFEILLFGYSVDGGDVQVIDFTAGETLPCEIIDALTDDHVQKWAFNANFERVCLSRHLSDMGISLDPFADNHHSADILGLARYLNPESWRCAMVWSAYMGMPLSLEGAGAVLGLEKQKLTEGKDLIRYFCKPCNPTIANGKRTRNLPKHAPDKWDSFRAYNIRDVETEMSIQAKLAKFPVPDEVWGEYTLDQEINDRGVQLDMTREAPQYHVKGSHEAIIRPEVFDLVQAELHKQKRSGKTRTCTHTFSSQIICGECGGTFGAKKWRTTTGGERLQRMIWQCNEKYRVKGKINCHTPHLTDNQLEYAFVTAFNLILRQKEQYISDYEPIIEMLTDVSALEKETATLREQQDELYTLVKNCIDEKARQGNDPALATQHKKLIGLYDAVKARLDDIASEIASRSVKNTKIKNFLEELQAQGDILTGFDETLWKRTADRIIVHRESDIVVEFKDGRQIRASVLGK